MNVYALAELVRVREREERERRGFVLLKNATKCRIATLFHHLVAADLASQKRRTQSETNERFWEASSGGVISVY